MDKSRDTHNSSALQDRNPPVKHKHRPDVPEQQLADPPEEADDVRPR